MGRIDGDILDAVMPPETTEGLKGRIAQLEVVNSQLRDEIKAYEAKHRAVRDYSVHKESLLREIEQLSKANDHLQEERDRFEQNQQRTCDKAIIVDVIKYLASLL